MKNEFDDITKEAILDVMGCRTRRDIMELLREEPRFVSQLSNELDVGQKAIIEHLRAMEEIGILESSLKKIERGRPRKYYKMPHDIKVNIIIDRSAFEIGITDKNLEKNQLQLPSGDEWSRLLNVEQRLRSGQLEALSELKSLIKLYATLQKRAIDVLEDVESQLNQNSDIEYHIK